jgi:hypothetical protein
VSRAGRLRRSGHTAVGRDWFQRGSRPRLCRRRWHWNSCLLCGRKRRDREVDIFPRSNLAEKPFGISKSWPKFWLSTTAPKAWSIAVNSPVPCGVRLKEKRNPTVHAGFARFPQKSLLIPALRVKRLFMRVRELCARTFAFSPVIGQQQNSGYKLFRWTGRICPAKSQSRYLPATHRRTRPEVTQRALQAGLYFTEPLTDGAA